MPVLSEFDHAFFREHGFVVMEGLLAAAEVVEINRLFDEDRRDFRLRWHSRGAQEGNYDALVTTPAFDGIVRHPLILQACEELMGGPLCFGEIGIRRMAPCAGESSQGWHRDRPHWDAHPLRMDYIQLMLYLSDVDEWTHCFSISPESVDDPIVGREEQLARDGAIDIHGPAGTVCLFNVAVLHTATVRRTEKERRTVQIYYGHRERRFLADDSVIPARFWKGHRDAEVRAFYGNLNGITRAYMEAFGVGE